MARRMKDVLQAHLENKRELFEQMRAYHDSEISHKEHAVTMLTTLLTAMGAVFAVLVFPDRQIPYPIPVAAVAAAIGCAFVRVIVRTTNNKIAADHARYLESGQEYARAAEALGLFEEVHPRRGVVVPAVKDPFVREKIGTGRGYARTQSIIRWVGVMVEVFVVSAALLVVLRELDRLGQGRHALLAAGLAGIVLFREISEARRHDRGSGLGAQASGAASRVSP